MKKQKFELRIAVGEVERLFVGTESGALNHIAAHLIFPGFQMHRGRNQLFVKFVCVFKQNLHHIFELCFLFAKPIYIPDRYHHCCPG